jgi:hypothetical protein
MQEEEVVELVEQINIQLQHQLLSEEMVVEELEE